MQLRRSPLLDLPVVALVTVSMVEFVVSRLLFNIGLPLPKTVATPQFATVVSFLAPFTVTASYFLAFMTLVLAAYILLKNSAVQHLIVAVGLLVLIQLSLVVSYPEVGTAASVGYPAVFAFTMISILVLGVLGSSKSQKISAALFAGSYLTSYFINAPLILDLIKVDVYAGHGAELFQAGELLAIINTIFLYFAFRPSLRERGWRSFVVPSVITMIFFVAYLANPWAITTVTMLTIGFSLFLPFPAYAVSIWLYSYIIIGSIREHKHHAFGLALIFLAGRHLQLSYLGLLAIAGLLLIFLPRPILEPQAISTSKQGAI